MYNSEPWPLNKKVQETKKSEKSSKKEVAAKAKEKFYSADIAVSTARVLKLFEDNKDKCYTNKDIAKELKISESTVSKITMRLEALFNIRIVGNRRVEGSSNGAQEFQHKKGLMPGFQRKTVKKGTNELVKDSAQAVKELFESNKNAVYTKDEVIEKLNNYSKDQVGESLQILVLQKDIKLLEDYEDNKVHYQHIRGNKKGVDVCYEPNEAYISVGTYLKGLNFVADSKKLKENLPKHFRMFHSTQGYVPQYLKSDLDKCLKKVEKKGFFGKVFG